MAWVWWLAAALALAVVEVLSLSLVLAMFAGGALVAGIAALLGWPMWVQIVLFGAVSGGLLFALRPWLLKHLRKRVKLVETNVHAQAGRTATTVTEVGPQGGRIKLVGEVWSARTEGDEVFAVDREVQVIRIDGATAVVGPVTQATTDDESARRES